MIDSLPSSGVRQRIADGLRMGGTIAFWVQLVLIITSVIILLFAIADPGFNLSFGSLLRLLPTIGAVAVLAYSAYWSWHYIGLSKQRIRSILRGKLINDELQRTQNRY